MIHVQSEVCLRSADAFDAAALATLRFEGLRELGLIEPSDALHFLPRARRELWEMLRADRAAAWILTIDGSVEGCACVVYWNRLPYAKTSAHAEICGVYVRPEFRRNGYATELVREAVATAHAHGVRKIVLGPTLQTRELYRSLGFDESGQMRMEG